MAYDCETFDPYSRHAHRKIVAQARHVLPKSAFVLIHVARRLDIRSWQPFGMWVWMSQRPHSRTALLTPYSPAHGLAVSSRGDVSAKGPPRGISSAHAGGNYPRTAGFLTPKRDRKAHGISSCSDPFARSERNADQDGCRAASSPGTAGTHPRRLSQRPDLLGVCRSHAKTRREIKEGSPLFQTLHLIRILTCITP